MSTLITLTMTDEQAARYDSEDGRQVDEVCRELRAILDGYEAEGRSAEIAHPEGFVAMCTR